MEVKVFCDTVCVYRNYLIINKTQVPIEKKKGKYGSEYSHTSPSDGPCPRGWGPAHAENGVPSPQIFHFNPGSRTRPQPAIDHYDAV